MEIIGDNSKLEIKVVGKSNVSSMNEWDKKWIQVQIYVQLIGFKANFRTELIEDDFKQFYFSLKEVLDKKTDTFELKTLEESIYLIGNVTYLGKIEWEDFVQFPIGNGNTLSFKFESDFFQIEKICSSLEQELTILKEK
jgi:hypothetical protein